MKGEYPGQSIGDLAKKLAAMWAKQSPKDRTPYEQKAAALRQKYEKVKVSEQPNCLLIKDLKKVKS